MQCLQFRKRGSLLPKILHLLIIIFPASTRKYVTSSARSPLAISKFVSLGIGQGRGKQNGKGVQECSQSFIMWFCIDGRLQCLAVNMLDIWRERKSQKGSSFVRIGKQVVGRRYHCKSPLVQRPRGWQVVIENKGDREDDDDKEDDRRWRPCRRDVDLM